MMEARRKTLERTVPASVDQITGLVDFVNDTLEEAGCPMKAQMQIDVALDEVLANIANYAYGGGMGDMTVSLELIDEPRSIVIRFTDSGVPYDPLTAKEPDTTLSAEERPIGGLGIFLVRKTMDSLDYEYKDGKNILTATKQF